MTPGCGLDSKNQNEVIGQLVKRERDGVMTAITGIWCIRNLTHLTDVTRRPERRDSS